MVLAECTCKNVFQDKMYGRGIRVHNPITGKDGLPEGRCTVCSTERRITVKR